MMNWIKAVLQARPLFDKIAALCVLMEHATGMLKWSTEFPIEFWRENDIPGQGTKERWANDKAYAIDLGDNQYKSRGARSATEVMVKDLNIDLKTRKDLRWLVDVTVRNNQTGYLKGLGGGTSVVYQLRELYKPGSFTAPPTTVEAVAHVIFTELRFQQMKDGKLVRHLDDLKNHQDLTELVADGNDPFTIPRYLRQMFCLGEEITEITRRVKFWLRAAKQAETMNRRATNDAHDRANFHKVGRFDIATITTDNERLARALFTGEKPPMFVVVEDSDGRVAILTDQRRRTPALRDSMRRLTARLQELDHADATWNFNEPYYAVMNGKPGSPTNHKLGWVVKTIGAYARIE